MLTRHASCCALNVTPLTFVVHHSPASCCCRLLVFYLGVSSLLCLLYFLPTSPFMRGNNGAQPTHIHFFSPEGCLKNKTRKLASFEPWSAGCDTPSSRDFPAAFGADGEMNATCSSPVMSSTELGREAAGATQKPL